MKKLESTKVNESTSPDCGKPVVRRSLKFKYKFGYISNEGYRHFNILYFAYGTNGFSACILGLHITAKLW